MKKIIIGIVLALSLIVFLGYNFFKQADARVSQGFREVNRVADSDGLDIVTYELYFSVTEKSSLNHLEGHFELTEYTLVDFEAEGEFEVVDWNESNLSYSLTSNKIYNASNTSQNEVVFATLILKETGGHPCNFNFYPEAPDVLPTNDVSITKNATSTKGGTLIDEVSDNDYFYYEITVKNESVIPTDRVTLTDTIPSEFEIIDPDGGEKNGNTITWDIGSMNVDEEITYYVRVRVIPQENRDEFKITNTATVTVNDNRKSAEATVEIVYSDITIEKKANVTEIRPNDSFTYTLTIKNTGTKASNNIIVTDTLDNDLTLIRASEQYTNKGNTYTFNLDSLEVNEVYNITLEVKLNANTTKDKITNIAIAQEEGKDDPKEDEVETPIVDSQISIEKVANKKEVKINNTFTYTIIVKNTGDVASKPITITDTLDNRLKLISSSVGNISANTFTYTINSLKVNETKEITLTAQVLDTAKNGEIINNIVTATEEGKNPIKDEEEIKVIDSKVTITKTVSKNIVSVGEEFTYTIKLENTSDYASDLLTLTDTINSDLEIINAKNGSINGQTITFNVGILNAHETQTYTITVKAKNTVNNNTTIPNVAILKEVGKPDQEDDASVTVVKPILSVTKKAVTNTNTNYVKKKEEFTYQIVVRNSGQALASNVRITDKIDDRLTIINSDGGNIDGNTITWNETIHAGSSITLNIRVKVKDNVTSNTIIPNQVVVTYNNEELTDEDDVFVTDSLIILEKKASVDKVKKQDEFYYIIRVSNIGTAKEENLLISDEVPNDLTIVKVETPTEITQNIDNNLIKLNIPSLDLNQTLEIKVHVKVTGDVKEKEKITNTAILTYDDEKLESSDDVIVIDSNISVEKTANKDFVYKGEEYTYTITINNSGSSSANNIEVIDTYDEGIEIIDADGGIVEESNRTIKWNITNIEANSSIKYTIKVKVNSDIDKDIILNHVKVHVPDKPDEEDEVEVEIGEPNLTITKNSSKKEVMKGSEYSYTITVTNNSKISVSNIKVTDKLDDRLIILENDGGVINQNEISWTFDLAASSSITFTVKVKVKEDVTEGKIPNIAIIHYDEEEIPSEEVIVKIVEIINPQTGNNLVKVSFIIIGIMLASLLIIYVKKKNRLFKI